MKVEYKVKSFIADNIDLYLKAKYYADNHREIFVERAKKIFGGTKKAGFLRMMDRTDKDYYVLFVNDERALGEDQMTFQVDLSKTRDFCSQMRGLILYSDISYESEGERVTNLNAKNTEFFNSNISLSETDLRNIRTAKYFVERYFE